MIDVEGTSGFLEHVQTQEVDLDLTTYVWTFLLFPKPDQSGSFLESLI